MAEPSFFKRMRMAIGITTYFRCQNVHLHKSMIDRAEIEIKARQFEIHLANVQRDYVFGWLLFGFFTTSSLKGEIFLKGGNALRKGYFENTRFSADLDFGMPGNIAPDVLMAEFQKVCNFIEAQAGVKFFQDEHKIKEKFSVTDAPITDLKVYEIRLYFSDFYGNSDHIKIRISIDFTRYDRVLLPIQNVALIHPYSDSSIVSCTIRCMKLEEIVATKLKCILQRQHVPDLFDYVYSVKQLGGNLDRRELVTTFIRKTIFDRNPHVVKEILLNSPFTFFRDFWEKGFVCAKQVAIGVEEAITFFTADLSKLFEIYPQNTFSAFAYFGADLRGPIMEAGRSMTCLNITYGGYERLVEPYSLRYMQRRDGAEREYFYVYDRVGGNSGPGIKALVAEKLTAIENTEEKFEPRFPVELSKAGEFPDDRFLFDPNKPTQRTAKARTTLYGYRKPQYIYRCSYCGKEFKRDRISGTLNPHKNKNGYPCSGRYGIYVTTKY
jgi:predicted nucleotidyltransferase component of viral defense system/DNA-directed RNA polymerase subunit RPC12/RpoP